MSLSIIIPSHNANLTIKEVLLEINAFIVEVKIDDYEILVIDDLSTDNSSDSLSKFKDKFKDLRIYKNPKNIGFCKTFVKGISHSKKDFIMFIPAGNVIDRFQMIKIYKALKDNDLVIVNYSNQFEARNLNRVIISIAFTFLVNIFFLKRIKYFNGTNIYRSVMLKKIKILSNSFVFQSEVVLKMMKLSNNYIECSVKLNNLKTKNSSFFYIQNIIKNINDSVKLIMRKII